MKHGGELSLLRITGIFWLFFIMPVVSQGNPFENVRWMSMKGYIKDLRTVGIARIDGAWTLDNMIHNRLNFKFYPAGFCTITLEIRNRFIYGETVKTYSELADAYPGVLPYSTYGKFIEQDDGIIRMSWSWLDLQSVVFNTAIDRAYFEIYFKKIELKVGRQRINWGMNYAWNPNDLFNNYVLTDFDYEERPGTDAARLVVYPTTLSTFEIAIAPDVDSPEKSTAAAYYRFNVRKYDLQFISGIYREKGVLGFGWAGDIKGAGFRGEWSYFHALNDFRGSRGRLTGAVSVDYTFKNSLFLEVEGLWVSNYEQADLSNPFSNAWLNPRPDAVFPAEFAFLLMGSYPVTPLWLVSFTGAYSPDGDLYFISPSMDFSIKENLDLTILAQMFRGDLFEIPTISKNLLFARLKWSF